MAGKRLGSLACGVHGFICASTVAFLLGASQTSGDNQSKDVTARLMGHSWGRLLVLVIGLVVVGAGVAIVVGAVRKMFTKHLSLGPDEPTHPHGRGDAGAWRGGPCAGWSSVSLACSWSSPR